VPGAGPEAWDRYAYGLDNPVKYSDPTGHRIDEGCGIGVSPDECNLPEGGGGSSGGGGGSGNNDDDRGGGALAARKPSTFTIPFDTQDWANLIFPGYAPEQLWRFGTRLDQIALLVDLLAEGVVAVHVGIGAAGFTFEGTPLSGPAGAGAGWIVGETSPITRGLVAVGNTMASAASFASVLADLKSGESRLYGSMTTSTAEVDLDVHLTFTTRTYVSISTATLGWSAQVVELSLALQSVAVLNDMAILPGMRVGDMGGIRIPFAGGR
jgi:hypothetical protein